MSKSIAWHILESTPPGDINMETLNTAAAALGGLYRIHPLSSGALQFVYQPGASVTLQQIVTLLSEHNATTLSAQQATDKAANDALASAKAAVNARTPASVSLLSNPEQAAALAEIFDLLQRVEIS